VAQVKPMKTKTIVKTLIGMVVIGGGIGYFMYQAMQSILESRDYTVVIASDKVGGMELVRIEKPDLLILDVYLVRRI
jgi:hypothetical protein